MVTRTDHPDSKMPACRFLRLRCGRKMDVSVFKIDGSAFENTLRLGILPEFDGQSCRYGSCWQLLFMAALIASARAREAARQGAARQNPRLVPARHHRHGVLRQCESCGTILPIAALILSASKSFSSPCQAVLRAQGFRTAVLRRDHEVRLPAPVRGREAPRETRIIRKADLNVAASQDQVRTFSRRSSE